MADEFRTNPKGGGGNQFVPLFLMRQGDYGYHQTFTGKIVHRRKRHFWTTADLLRVLPKTAQAEEEKADQTEKFTWWEKLMNFLAEYMISKLTTWMSTSEDVPQIIWAWLNKTYHGFLVKITGLSELERLHSLYSSRLEEAVNDYTQNGDYTGLDSIFNALSKGD